MIPTGGLETEHELIGMESFTRIQEVFALHANSAPTYCVTLGKSLSSPQLSFPICKNGPLELELLQGPFHQDDSLFH